MTLEFKKALDELPGTDAEGFWQEVLIEYEGGFYVGFYDEEVKEWKESITGGKAMDAIKWALLPETP